MSGKRFCWSDAAHGALFELWEENFQGFRGVRKNSHIYKEMAENLKEFGPTEKEIKNKIDNITKKYRSELAKVGCSGGSSSSWPYFDRVQYILQGGRNIVTPTGSTDFSTMQELSSSQSSLPESGELSKWKPYWI